MKYDKKKMVLAERSKNPKQAMPQPMGKRQAAMAQRAVKKSPLDKKQEKADTEDSY